MCYVDLSMHLTRDVDLSFTCHDVELTMYMFYATFYYFYSGWSFANFTIIKTIKSLDSHFWQRATRRMQLLLLTLVNAFASIWHGTEGLIMFAYFCNGSCGQMPAWNSTLTWFFLHRRPLKLSVLSSVSGERDLLRFQFPVYFIPSLSCL